MVQNVCMDFLTQSKGVDFILSYLTSPYRRPMTEITASMIPQKVESTGMSDYSSKVGRHRTLVNGSLESPGQVLVKRN